MGKQAPAGWYPDGQGSDRYWDGAAWTEQLREPDVSSEAELEGRSKKGGAFSKLGAAVRNTAAQMQADKAERAQKLEEAAQAAGALVTSGVFGTTIVEIYAGGYVRIASEAEKRSSTGGRLVKAFSVQDPSGIPKSAPYEKLRSITIALPEAEQPAATAAAPLDDAIGKTVTTIFNGGRALMKASTAGIATAGIAHVAKAKSRKTFLTITTDKTIHSLTNETNNGLYTAPNKGHEAVGMQLVAVANEVLGLPAAAGHSNAQTAPASEQQASGAPQPEQSSDIGRRLRELAGLHGDGILSDEEFAAAKAKLLGGL